VTGAEFEGVDIDLLADYVGGALDGTPDQERVAGLVATDDTWRTAYEALEPGMIAVGAMLRELEPEPMPDDLAARLDTLLGHAAPVEPASDSRAPAPASAESGPVVAVPSKVVDLDKARRRRRWVAPLTVAAAAVAFAGFGVNALLTSPSAEDSSAGMTSAENAPMADSAAAAGEVTRSGIDYTERTLAQATATQLRSAGGSADSPQVSSGQEFASPRLETPDAVAACLQEITRVNGGGVISVEFMDYARFNGDPALIVRFFAANGTWVWAVGPDCGTPGAGADELERVPVR
jgi:negative regulator of sigma E activity